MSCVLACLLELLQIILHVLCTALFIRAPTDHVTCLVYWLIYLSSCRIMLHVLCTALFIRAPTGSCYMSCVLPCLLELLQDHVTCLVYCLVY